jgi:hypothetical protein
VTRAGCVLLAAALVACGTTGGNVVDFQVVARGAGSTSYPSAFGWHIELARATLHIGAVYLNLTRPNSGLQDTQCILPGVYTAQELAPIDVDVLSTAPQPFAEPGTGTDDEALTGEVWLTGGDVNADSDATVIADLAGTATKDAQVLPFSATIQINSANRGIPGSPAFPGLHPICKQRIVSPILIDLRPHTGGTLAVIVDPSGWFANVDFSQIPPDGVFPDERNNTASDHLFNAIRAATATFQFSFQ